MPRPAPSKGRLRGPLGAPLRIHVTHTEKIAEIASEDFSGTIIFLSSNIDVAGFDAIPHEDFLARGRDVPEIEPVPYRPEHIAAIVYTGASTGAAKGVMLSDYSFNAMGIAWTNSGYQFACGKKLLDVLPLFIAYGVCNALHVPLMCVGGNDCAC